MSAEKPHAFIPLVTHGRRVLDLSRRQYNVPLLKAISLAFYWQHLLDTHVMNTAQAIARAEQMDASLVGQILRLTVLAPDLIERCLRAEQSRCLHIKRLLRTRLSPEWRAQRAWFAMLDEEQA